MSAPGGSKFGSEDKQHRDDVTFRVGGKAIWVALAGLFDPLARLAMERPGKDAVAPVADGNIRRISKWGWRGRRGVTPPSVRY